MVRLLASAWIWLVGLVREVWRGCGSTFLETDGMRRDALSERCPRSVATTNMDRAFSILTPLSIAFHILHHLYSVLGFGGNATPAIDARTDVFTSTVCCLTFQSSWVGRIPPSRRAHPRTLPGYRSLHPP
jgi:hypothetical protein